MKNNLKEGDIYKNFRKQFLILNMQKEILLKNIL